MNHLNLRFRWKDENGREQTFDRGDQYLMGFLRRGLLLATGHAHESYVEGNIEDYLEQAELAPRQTNTCKDGGEIHTYKGREPLCIDCGIALHQPTQDSGEWEAEFDEQFNPTRDPECEHGILPAWDCPNRRCEKRTVYEIQKFIRTLLADQQAKHDTLILQFVASTTLSENLGDVWDDVREMLKRIGKDDLMEEFDELQEKLHSQGITTLYGTSIEPDEDDEEDL